MPQFLKLEHFLPPNFILSRPDKQLYHIFDEADCYALWAAYAAGRPLLVRGKPGTGKSQMAKAIAEQLGWAFVSEVIRGSTELSDLHWHFDAIGRLSEAQAMSFRPKETTEDWENRTNPLRFLSPGAFWWAYDWKSAEQQYQMCVTKLRPRPDWYSPSFAQYWRFVRSADLLVNWLWCILSRIRPRFIARIRPDPHACFKQKCPSGTSW